MLRLKFYCFLCHNTLQLFIFIKICKDNKISLALQLLRDYYWTFAHYAKFMHSSINIANVEWKYNTKGAKLH